MTNLEFDSESPGAKAPAAGTIKPPLTAGERHAEILRQLHSSPFVSVTDLVAKLGVSDMTIRRDLKQLSSAGEVQVVHGGASLAHSTLRTADFFGRAQHHSAAKQQIAEAAQQFIAVDSIIAMDAGTTAFAVINALPAGFRGTVITHSVPVLQHMLSLPHVKVLGLGGELVADSQALVGPRAVEGLAGLRADVFFLGAAAVSHDGIYVSTDIERPIKQAFMSSSTRVVLLADHGKMTTTAAVRLSGFDQIDVAITDRMPPEQVLGALERKGTQLIVAGPAGVQS